MELSNKTGNALMSLGRGLTHDNELNQKFSTTVLGLLNIVEESSGCMNYEARKKVVKKIRQAIDNGESDSRMWRDAYEKEETTFVYGQGLPPKEES